ncbi:MAG: hypothetical protein HUU03_11650 [Planctomycetaceae bacterium]|nr:hypothetical protein [Planctomycetota bacterium]NUO17082.1 hypothetical protein [Planctomycetaceae bacterium]GIK51689.1 MAG: hypothetical protein BroJett014_06620 [Planctomycetota bacterium]HRJ78131.1 hypothetical protein [Planctomycetota bacterium]
MSNHRATLEAIKRTRAARRLMAQKNDPSISCRREFRREETNQVVEFCLFDRDGRRVARGNAVLLDYSPHGAKIGHVRFDEGFWPDGEFSVSLRITGGQFEGVQAHGLPLRFATTSASLAIRFDALYVKL